VSGQNRKTVEPKIRL